MHSEYPLYEWYHTHPELYRTETWRLVEVLKAAWDANGKVHQLEEEWESWWSNPSLPVPDLVLCVSEYGHSRWLTREWAEFPIQVPPDKVDAWREWGFGASLFEFREKWQGGLAGGFLELAGRNPQTTVQILERQLDTRVDRLIDLTTLPTDWYTPQEFTEDERAEMEDGGDRRRIAEPFVIFQELTCFEYALPIFRMIAAAENAPEVGLPNLALHEALMKIDLNRLISRLHDAEGALRNVLHHLDKFGYPYLKYEFNVRTAPQEFWWRHWNTRGKPKK